MNSNGRLSRIASLLIILALAVLFLLAGVTGPAAADDAGQAAPDEIWFDIREADIDLQGERLIVPDRYRTLGLNPRALLSILQSAPLEFNAAAGPIVLNLPLPDGRTSRFQIIESPVMAPELAARFPEIKTYAGRGLDEPAAIARFDWTPHGFHAMILSPAGTVYIDPFSRGDTQHYISYNTRDYSRKTGFVELGPLGDNAEVEGLLAGLQEASSAVPSGDELRTYRLAMAATGEYTQYHGGTVPDALAEIVTAMNRVNGIYERDVAVRMELIANNNLIIYTNGATDPYTNNNGFLMLGENQANLDAVIGNANYDIGHVFSTGGGGVASLGVPCRTGLKARGVTGLSNPIGDPFYVDYVAHEIGHQYGANHTFNGNAGSCSGNRNGSTAWEPGSGTTIMAYAGICAPQNTQNFSDDHFHTGSIDEIRTYTVLGLGNSCAAVTTTGNSPPVVDGGSDYTIPLDTPFTLTGSAADPESDPLTYNWEQYDLGPAGHPNNPVGDAPLFRSFSSLSTPSRTFPQIADIVNNTQTIGEILPFYARGMTFRFTVRDNNISPSAGGVDSDEVEVTVSGNAGPFLVTDPNTAETWSTGTMEAVTWDVASTDQAPVNCAAVDLRLSTDGGYTYPVTLASGVPNDGSEMVLVPTELTTSARVRVSCAGNIFFDISDANFTIEAGVPFAALSIGKQVDPVGSVSPGQALTYTVAVTNSGNLTATTTVTDTFPTGLTGVTCAGVPGDLLVVQDIPPAGQASFECLAQVDPGLGIELHKALDRPIVGEGEAVTYTLTVTNPHGALTMTNVLLTDPLVGTCLPALGVPFELGPGASQGFVCPGVVITDTVTNTASVTAEFLIANQAEASASEDPSGPVSSGLVTSLVAVAASAEATVELAPVYYLFLPVSVRN